jgi:hypothetical protein
MADLKLQLALAEIEQQSEQAQEEIDLLMAEMERVPAEQRSAGEWGPSGTQTQRFLELSALQNELADEHKKISRAIADAAARDAKPPEKLN